MRSKNNPLPAFFILLIALYFSACYSFKGIAIPPEINTYYVENFVNREADAPIDIEVTFAEALRAKVRNESRLKYDEVDPDIQFSGDITRFSVDYEAPEEGNTVALNKLTIGVQVVYKNNRDEKDTWSKSFSFFRTFDKNQDLASIQGDLIEEIFSQITESVFNDAFTDW